MKNKIWNGLTIIIKNIDITLTITIAIIVGVLGLLGISKTQYTASATLALLGLTSVTLLSLRRSTTKNNENDSQIAKSLDQFNSIASSKVDAKKFFTRGYHQDLKSEIKAARTVKIFSIGLTTTRHFYPQFRDVLDRGGNIKIVISNRSKALLDVICFRSSGITDPRKYNQNLESNLEQIKVLKEFSKESENFEIKEIPYFPAVGLFIIEDENGGIKIFARVYGFRSISSDNPGFLVGPQDGYWFNYFIKQFDELWEEGSSIEI